MLCVLSDTLVLGCMMFIFCVKEADLGMMAFVAYFALGFQNSTPCLSACTMHSVTRKQHPCPSNTRRWFRHFLVISVPNPGLPYLFSWEAGSGAFPWWTAWYLWGGGAEVDWGAVAWKALFLFMLGLLMDV